MSEIDVHPVQTKYQYHKKAVVPKVVTMRAYEVYQRLFGKQEALISGECRGGFGMNELVAFLYAGTFPEKEWRDRVEEALTGMDGV